MKVILLSDIERLGQLGDTVMVSRGYGRNYLIPQGYALLATSSNIALFEKQRAQYQAKMDTLRGQAYTIKERIENVGITIQVRTGENNKLYGSVTTQMIAEALEQEGISIDRRKILLDAPIRSLGDYSIRIRLHADIIAEFTIHVCSDRADSSLDDTIEEVAVEEKADGAIIEASDS